MKNKKILTISFKSLDDFENEILQSLHLRKEYIKPHNIIYFDSLKGFRDFMTVQKLEILAAISTRKPKSIYELAKVLDRDTAPTQRDCTVLMNAGFIDLKESKDLRRSKVPTLKFDYNCLLIELPKLSYELHFKAAA